MCFAPQTVCNFSSLICPAGSAPAALASLLFDPLEPQTIGKTQCFATFLPFRAPGSSFFWDFLFLLLFSWLTLPISAFHLSILSEIWLLNFLRLENLSIMAALSAWTSTLPSLINFLQLPRRQLEDGSSSELHLQPLLRPSLGWHFDQDKHCEEQHQPRLARRGRSLLHCAQPGAGTAGPAGMDISMESVVNQGKPWQTYKNKHIWYHLIIMLHYVHICEPHSSSSPNWFIVMDQHFVLPKGSS